MQQRVVAVLVLPVLACACAPAPGPAHAALTPLPPLSDVVTTLERTLVPAHGPATDGLNPALPTAVQRYLDDGVGDLTDGSGASLIVRTADGAPAPARGLHPIRLARFVHLSDIQLMDDESPGRAADFDSTSVTSAIRPHDPDICRMLNASVRTINALNARDPVDFLLLGGDNSDSAQENEVRWVMQILDGAPEVRCDSGHADTALADGADGKAAFASVGLDIPWRWVSGNHDSLVQGTFAVDDAQRGTALGTLARLGTRDYSGGGFGGILDGDGVIPDASRALLDGPALLKLVGSDGDGHGLKDADVARGKAFSTYDLPGSPVTFLILDTTHGAGGAEGVLQQRDVDAFVKPALDDALARKRLVVLASHHAVDSLSADGGIFGHAESDALTADAWRALLAQYPNVLFSMVGHSHRHQVRLQQTPQQAFWEVMTSALADWPHQFRIVEIWDDDNGTLRLESSPVDFAADDNPPAALGRSLGLIDFLSGWQPNDGRGALEDRNVSLIVKKPDALTP